MKEERISQKEFYEKLTDTRAIRIDNTTVAVDGIAYTVDEFSREAEDAFAASMVSGIIDNLNGKKRSKYRIMI